MTEEPVLDPKRGLVTKLNEVIQSTRYIQKQGRVDSDSVGHYNYALEKDLIEMIRPELAKRNVLAFPTTEYYERHGRKRGSGTNTSEVYGCDVLIKWTFMDGDSGQTLECKFPGSGDDSQRKGYSIAMTFAMKSFLQKFFLIPTGDDPDEHANHVEEERERATNNQYESEQIVDDLPEGVKVVGTPGPPLTSKDFEEATKWTKMDPGMPGKPPSIWWKTALIAMCKELAKQYDSKTTVGDISLRQLIMSRIYIERVENHLLGYVGVAHDQLASAFSDRIAFELYHGKLTRQKVKNKEGKMVFEYYENVSET